MTKEIKFRLNNVTNMPVWMINNYISILCEHCMKLYIFDRVNDLISDCRVIFMRKDIPVNKSDDIMMKLIEKNEINILNYLNAYNFDINIKHNEYCLLSYENIDSFKTFLKLKRPMCFIIDSNNQVNYLYDSFENEVLKVTDFEYHSPAELAIALAPTVIILIKTIIELIWEYQKNKRQNEREDEEHKLKMQKLLLEKYHFLQKNNEAFYFMQKYYNKICSDFIEMGLEIINK